jgi:hypothetical protein
MRTLPSLLLLLPLAACGDETLTLRGSLLDGTPGTEVYVVGQSLRAPIEADSFVIEDLPAAEVVEIEFAEEGERLGRMRIEKWNGRDVGLRGIWVEDGVAFASALDGEATATVNGLRMAGPEALPRSVGVRGRVLALSGDADALVLRPDDESLPDLRVLVTPGTAFEWESGEPADVYVSIGDSLRVEGPVEAGYVVATALILPVPPAEEEIAPAETPLPEVEQAEPQPDEEPEEVEREETDGPRSLQRPGRGKGRGRGLQLRRD